MPKTTVYLLVTMESLFKPAFFANNRAKLRELFKGSAPIVISANGEMQKSGDTAFRFKQDSSFWYFTGLSVPDAVLVMDKTKEYIILSEYHDIRAKFDGSLSLVDIAKKSQISDILDYKSGWKRLEVRLKKVKHVATLAAAATYVPRYGFYANPARAKLIEQIKSINPALKPLDLKNHVLKLRSIKQPEELLAIQNAINATEKSVKKVGKAGWASFKSEFEIETELAKQFRINSGHEPSFIIVAAGINSCTIHHRPDSLPLPVSGALVLDVGAEVEGYVADISRSYYLGASTKRYKQVMAAVLDVYEHALSKVKPGMVIRAYEQEISQYMGEKLRELGLIRNVTNENVRKFYPHLTSHFLGLDAHDIGDYDKPLEPNMVITVEPGIYIPKEKIGIRLEDDVLITADGHKVLSSGLPLMPS